MREKADRAQSGLAALIVFGLDEAGKPHASSFGQADAELAEKAARLMGLRILRVETHEHREIAAKLPQGRVFESGKGFVPFVKAAVYERLSALCGAGVGGEADQAGSPAEITASPPAGSPMPDATARGGAPGVAASTPMPTTWQRSR
jgi:hypothetical protein